MPVLELLVDVLIDVFVLLVKVLVAEVLEVLAAGQGNAGGISAGAVG